MHQPSFLKLPSGGRIAYHKTEGKGPGILFLGGFRSDMTGVKATALESFCKERGHGFIRFDYEGHGQSSGAFEEGTIGRWYENAQAVFEKLAKGPHILVGSSMGGWLALLLAMRKPRKAAGLIGIAAAPDFTEHLIWDKFTESQRARLQKEGRLLVPSDYGEPYTITKELIVEGRNHLLLGKEIPIFCPVRLLHGMKDDDVPWEISLAVNEKLASSDVKTILVEEGDHRLSEPADIERLLRVTGKMLEQLGAGEAFKG